jgi:hypothetical protein
MFITILSGRVAEENWRQLENSFEKAVKHAPNGVQSSVLIHCLGESHLWQIITTWESKEAYTTAKDKNLANTCFDLFCDAGSTPHRNEFSVLGKYTRV